MKKSQVISIRVSSEVANIFEEMCAKKGKTKNDVLSDLITRNYNLIKTNSQLSNLEKLLIQLKNVVPVEEFNYMETPCIILGTLEDDGEEYAGKKQILVGDDTIIREKNGMFYVFDMNHPHLEPILMKDKEILDFYEGQNYAYGVPDLEDYSYHFIRGYIQVIKRLIDYLEDDFEKYTNLKIIGKI